MALNTANGKEVAVTDWSGGRFGGPNPVGGPDRRGQDGPSGSAPHRPSTPGQADRWAPGPSSARGPWPAQPPQPTEWKPQPQPWQPPPTGGGQPPAGPPAFGQPFGLPPGPPRKSRKPLFITLAAGGAVIVVVAIVLVITLAGGTSGPGGGSAGDVVKGYLEALSRGDAEAALSYSDDQPASKEFLTDDILKKQLANSPITNVRILNDDSSSTGSFGMAQVHVAANFGNKTSDATMEMKKDHNRWRLSAAAIKVQPDPAGTSLNAAAKTLTFFGKPIGDSTVYVFPGWVDIGTTNPYMTVTAKPLLLDQLTLMAVPWIQPTFALSDKGRDAVSDQLAVAMANCLRSNLLAPPGCPVHLDPYGLADGTVHWGNADMTAVKLDNFDQYHLALMFFGEVKMAITVQTSSGGTKQGDVSDFLNGTADLTKTPPALQFR
jgi:hypothetical protein